MNAHKGKDSEPTAVDQQGGSKNRVDPSTWTGYFVELRANELFEGFMVNGLRHGDSRFTWADNDVMICNWMNGRCPAHDKIDKQKKEPIALGKTRSQNPKPEPRQKQFFNHSGVISSVVGKRSTHSFHGQCVQCKNVCESEEHFHCMNCKAHYCKNCEQEWMEIGYQAIRPPCYCVISSNGCTTKLNETDFRTWIPKLVLGHFFNTRTAAATLNSTMMIIEFSSAEPRRHNCTTICHIGSLKPENKGHLLDQETIRNYVTSCQPKPSVFLQIMKRWELPPETETYPMAVNTEIHNNTWHWNFKKKARC